MTTKKPWPTLSPRPDRHERPEPRPVTRRSAAAIALKVLLVLLGGWLAISVGVTQAHRAQASTATGHVPPGLIAALLGMIALLVYVHGRSERQRTSMASAVPDRLPSWVTDRPSNGPSVGRIALGVFLGMWMFMISLWILTLLVFAAVGSAIHISR